MLLCDPDEKMVRGEISLLVVTESQTLGQASWSLQRWIAESSNQPPDQVWREEGEER